MEPPESSTKKDERTRSSVRFFVPEPAELGDPGDIEASDDSNSNSSNDSDTDSQVDLESEEDLSPQMESKRLGLRVNTNANRETNNHTILVEDSTEETAEKRNSLITFETLQEELSESISVSSDDLAGDIGTIEYFSDEEDLEMQHDEQKRNENQSRRTARGKASSNHRHFTISSRGDPRGQRTRDMLHSVSIESDATLNDRSLATSVSVVENKDTGDFQVKESDPVDSPRGLASFWGDRRSSKRSSKTFPASISVEKMDQSTQSSKKFSFNLFIESLVPPKFGRRLTEQGFQRHVHLRTQAVPQFLCASLLFSAVYLIVFNTQVSQTTIESSQLMPWFNTILIMNIIFNLLLLLAPYGMSELRLHFSFLRMRAIVLGMISLLVGFGLDILSRRTNEDPVIDTFLHFTIVFVMCMLPLYPYTILFSFVLTLVHHTYAIVISVVYQHHESVVQLIPSILMSAMLLWASIFLGRKKENRLRANWLNSLELGKNKVKGFIENGRKWTLINGMLPIAITRKVFLNNKLAQMRSQSDKRGLDSPVKQGPQQEEQEVEEEDGEPIAEQLGQVSPMSDGPTSESKPSANPSPSKTSTPEKERRTKSSSSPEKERRASLKEPLSPLASIGGSKPKPETASSDTNEIQLRHIPSIKNPIKEKEQERDLESGDRKSHPYLPKIRDHRRRRLDISPRTSQISGDNVCVIVLRLLHANDGTHVKAIKRVESFSFFHESISEIAANYGLMMGPWMDDRLIVLGGFPEHEEIIQRQQRQLQKQGSGESSGRTTSRASMMSSHTNQTTGSTSKTISVWNHDVPSRSAEFVLDVVNTVQQNSGFVNENVRLRVGMATGRVIGAVVGRTRFAFDVFGSTVDEAKQLEETGENSKIHVCPKTYLYLVDDYDFQTIILRSEGISKVYTGEVQRTHFLLKRKLATVLQHIRRANQVPDRPSYRNPNLPWLDESVGQESKTQEIGEMTIKAIHGHLGFSHDGATMDSDLVSRERQRSQSDAALKGALQMQDPETGVIQDDEGDEHLQSLITSFLGPRLSSRTRHANVGMVPLWQLVPNSKTIKSQLLEKEIKKQFTRTLIKRHPSNWKVVERDVDKGISRWFNRFVDPQKEHMFMSRITTRNRLVYKQTQNSLSAFLLIHLMMVLGLVFQPNADETLLVGGYITLGISFLFFLAAKASLAWVFENEEHEFKVSHANIASIVLLTVLECVWAVLSLLYMQDNHQQRLTGFVAALSLVATGVPHFALHHIVAFNVGTIIITLVEFIFIHPFGHDTLHMEWVPGLFVPLIAIHVAQTNGRILHQNYAIMLKVIRELRLSDQHAAQTNKILHECVPSRLLQDLHRNSSSDFVAYTGKDGIVCVEILGLEESLAEGLISENDFLQCIHELYLTMDEIVEKFAHSSKVKSFGYLYVVTVQETSDTDAATRMCELAFKLQQEVQRFKVELFGLEEGLDARVAMTQGTYTAGIVAITHFGFDVVGPVLDTLFAILDNTSPGFVVTTVSVSELLSEDDYVSNLCASVKTKKGRMNLYAIDRVDFANDSRSSLKSSRSGSRSSMSSSSRSIKGTFSPLKISGSIHDNRDSDSSGEKLAALFDHDTQSTAARSLRSPSSIHSGHSMLSKSSHRLEKLPSVGSERSQLRRDSSNRSAKFKPFFDMAESIAEEDEVPEEEEEE